MRPTVAMLAVTMLAVALAAPLPSLAAGGGDGGGSSLPSSSGPAYDPAVEYAKGVAALKAKDYPAADRAFARVLDAAPRDAATLYMSGLAKSGKGDLKGARKAYEKSLKAKPGQVPALRDLAVTLARLGAAEDAKARLAELNARVATCATTCGEAGQLNEAVAQVEAALANPSAAAPASPGAALDAPAGDRAYLVAVGLINERRYGEALAALDRAHAAFGPHPDVLTYMGYVHRQQGALATARRHYEAALAIAPRHRGATEYYGELKVATGDLAGARAMLARLDADCTFGCAEAEELRRWVTLGRAPA